MADTDELVLDTPDELTTLKARADLLGVKFHPSISLEKLRDKVNTVLMASDKPVETVQPTLPDVETENQFRTRMRNEANELVRIRVSCMNPAKKEWEGEIFTSGNSVVGSFTKYVPFNAEEGWHVPKIIYNQLVERKCQVFYSTPPDSRGNSTRKGKLIKEFSIEVLPNLTTKELNELARRQAMAKSTD